MTSAQRRGCWPLSRSPCWPLHHPEGPVTPDDLAHNCHKIPCSERWATCASKNPAGRVAALPGWFAPTARCLRPHTHGSSWGLQRTADAGDGGVAPSRPAGDAASIQVTAPMPTRRGGSTSRPMISSWQSPPSRDALLPGGVTSRLCRVQVGRAAQPALRSAAHQPRLLNGEFHCRVGSPFLLALGAVTGLS